MAMVKKPLRGKFTLRGFFTTKGKRNFNATQQPPAKTKKDNDLVPVERFLFQSKIPPVQITTLKYRNNILQPSNYFQIRGGRVDIGYQKTIFTEKNDDSQLKVGFWKKQPFCLF